MSNLVVNKVKSVVGGDDFRDKINTLFKGDVKKIESFKSNLIKIVSTQNIEENNLMSVIQSAISIAELDLSLNPSMGLCYILKYKNDFSPIISYKGYISLAERAGKIIKVDSIFKCDVFEMESDGFDDKVTFKKNLDDRDEDNKDWYEKNFRGVFIRIKDLNNGEIFYHFVGKNKIYKIMGVSPSVKKNNSSPYDFWWQEMHLAKAIKYVLSKTTINNDISKAIEIDNNLDKDLVEEAIIEDSRSSDISNRIIKLNKSKEALIKENIEDAGTTESKGTLFNQETGEVEGVII